MRKALIVALLLVVGSFALGATVFRDQIANAAQSVSATIIGPLDGNGNVAVHEQGTADVRITDSSLLTVAPRGARTTEHHSLATAPGQQLLVPFDAGAIDASLIALTSMQGRGYVLLENGSTAPPLRFETDGGNVVLPLTQPLTVDRILLACEPASALWCSAEFNVVGR